jgi:hypothetical protein
VILRALVGLGFRVLHRETPLLPVRRKTTKTNHQSL